jgi:hydroxymethylbilane synthase
MSDSSSIVIRLGTRGSALAMWQAEWVASQLSSLGARVELIKIQTEGDVRTAPIGQLGTQGVFTKEIQRALLDDRIDLAVHSLKDLPTEAIDGLCLTAVPQRESPGDALVTAVADSIDQLPPGSKVGTGSLRRRAQLLSARPDLTVVELRGNVGTRLRKLREGQCDALILAEAGLRRLNLQDHITQVLPKSLMLPAVGQGALGLETRQDDQATRAFLHPLDDPETHSAVLAERTLLARLHGGCRAPVGAWGRVEDQQLWLDAVVLVPDGSQRRMARASRPLSDAVALGHQVADDLLAQGAQELLQAARES